MVFKCLCPFLKIYQEVIKGRGDSVGIAEECLRKATKMFFIFTGEEMGGSTL